MCQNTRDFLLKYRQPNFSSFLLLHSLALPNNDPTIHGLKPYYIMGDVVAANCTSDASYPPATLTWFINDEKV